jgi:hypothetical protein
MKDRDIDDIMKEIGKETVPLDVYKKAEEMSRDFSESLAKSQQAGHHILFTRIATSRITRLAAAAVIVIAFGVGFSVGRWSRIYQPETAGPEVVVIGPASAMYSRTVASEDGFWQQKARTMMRPSHYGQRQLSTRSLLDAYKQYLKEKYNG